MRLLCFACNDRGLVSDLERSPDPIRPRGDSAPAGRGV